MFGCCLTDTCVTLGWWLQEQTQRPWQSLQPCLSPPKILVLNWLNPNPNLPGDCPATDQLYSSPTSLQESQHNKALPPAYGVEHQGHCRGLGTNRISPALISSSPSGEMPASGTACLGGGVECACEQKNGCKLLLGGSDPAVKGEETPPGVR